MAAPLFRRIMITITVVSVALLQLIDTTIVNVAIPVIQGNLGATLSEATWIVAGYAVANAIVVPMTGWLSATLGRRNYYLGSIALFTLASALCGQASTIWELIFFRIIQGVGGGALLATSQTILVEAYPPEQLGLANALFGIGAVVGPTIGPLLGGWLTDNYSWPWIFYVNIPVGIVAILLTLLFIEDEQSPTRSRRVDWPGILLLTIGVGALQTLLERGQDEDWFESSLIVTLTVVAVLGLLLFVWWELHTDTPVVNLRVLRHRNTAIGTLFVFILGFGLYASVFIYPVFVQNLLGFSAYQTGLSLLPGGLTTMAVLPLTGLALRRGVSPKLLTLIGFISFFVFAWELSNETLQSGPEDFFWPLIIRGFAMGFLFVPLTTVALSGLQGAEVAQATGLTNMLRQLGGSFGLAAISTFIERDLAFHRHELSMHLTPFSAPTRQFLQTIQHGLVQQGMDLTTAQQSAYGLLNQTLIRQALVMTYNDAFFYAGLFFLLCIPLLLLLPRLRPSVSESHLILE